MSQTKVPAMFTIFNAEAFTQFLQKEQIEFTATDTNINFLDLKLTTEKQYVNLHSVKNEVFLYCFTYSSHEQILQHASTFLDWLADKPFKKR